MTPLRVALAFAMLALGHSHACGFMPDDLKDEGEPCTRTSECRSFLECRGGVCMGADAGTEEFFDASTPDGRLDASAPGGDASRRDASAPRDAASDASTSDAATADGGAADGG